jgi:hypothetical protein
MNSRLMLALLSLSLLVCAVRGAPQGALGTRPTVSLNTQGGTLDGSKLTRDMWIALEVQAPRDMTVVRFEIFSKTLTGPDLLPATIVRPLAGPLPPIGPALGTMYINHYSGWHGVEVTPTRVAAGERFYIAFRTPKAQDMLLPLKGGAMGTAYGNTGGIWTSAQQMRVGWRVYTYDGSLTVGIGHGCRTPLSQGEGTISYQAGLNAEAGLNGGRYYADVGRFAWPLHMEREGRILALSLLVTSQVNSSWMTVEVYRKDPSALQPGQLIEAKNLVVGTITDWVSLSFDPIPVAKDETIWIAVMPGPQPIAFEADRGEELLPLRMGPGLSNWAFTNMPIRPAMRVHMVHADGEHVHDSSPLTGAAASDTLCMIQRRAESDMWINGFSMRMRAAAGSMQFPVELRLARPDGLPDARSSRNAVVRVDTLTDWITVYFDPIFVPKNAWYYIGYRTPSASQGQLLVGPSGASSGSVYYRMGAGQSQWQGPFASPQHAFRISSAVHMHHAMPGSFAPALNADREYAVRDVAPRDMWVSGFSVWMRSNTARPRVLGRFYRDTNGQPGLFLRENVAYVESSAGWVRFHFKTPAFVRKGDAYHFSFATPPVSTPLEAALAQGAALTVHSRAAKSPQQWQSEARCRLPSSCTAVSALLISGATPTSTSARRSTWS